MAREVRLIFGLEAANGRCGAGDNQPIQATRKLPGKQFAPDAAQSHQRGMTASTVSNLLVAAAELDFFGTACREILVHVIAVLPATARIREAECKLKVRIDLVPKEYPGLDQVRAED
jgi:hypothetical protein